MSPEEQLIQLHKQFPDIYVPLLCDFVSRKSDAEFEALIPLGGNELSILAGIERLGYKVDFRRTDSQGFTMLKCVKPSPS